MGGEFTDRRSLQRVYAPSVRHTCRSMRIAGDNVQADFCAVAADKCKAQVNLLASRGPGGCLSLSLSAETQEGQILSFLGFGRRNLHMQWSCIYIQTSCSCIRATTSRRADELAPTRLASPVDGAQQGARRTVSMITSPMTSPITSPAMAICQQTSGRRRPPREYADSARCDSH